ncbi:MAG: LysM peptidoglycan-binding domain-containing protein [Deltaproteobacteria bacterium]|nr:LysM peptidoglycan-binding domain-containing protein [Deltaproteobacteria bacterium]
MSEEQNMEEMMKMWREQPETVRIMFPAGMGYEIQKGDTLANLGERFGIPWQTIAEATMGTSDPKAINKWLQENGGKKLPSGYWAFNEGQEIKIPPPAEEGVS